MRGKPLFLGLMLGALSLYAMAPALAQTPSGRWESYAPRVSGLPNTAWVKAEVLGEDAVSEQVGAAVNAQLRLHGYDSGPGGSYSVRIELRGRGLSTPMVPIPGYRNATQRLSIWPEPDQPNAIYLSLLLYHQSTGQVFWQGEAVCIGVLPDALNIVNAMVGPLMEQLGHTGKASLDCRKV